MKTTKKTMTMTTLSLLALCACGGPAAQLPTAYLNVDVHAERSTACDRLTLEGLSPIGTPVHSCGSARSAEVIRVTLTCDDTGRVATASGWGAWSDSVMVYPLFGESSSFGWLYSVAPDGTVTPDDPPVEPLTAEGDALVARYDTSEVGKVVERHRLVAFNTETQPYDDGSVLGQECSTGSGWGW